MVNKKSSVIIAAILGLCCFFSAVYISSCTKPSKGPSCDNYACENGGYCSVDTFLSSTSTFYPLSNGKLCDCPGSGQPMPHCTCPSGYEGTNCATVSKAKYLGTWDVKQTVIGSDSANIVGTDSLYSVILETTPTPTTFMIVNLCGDIYYNDVICTIDSGGNSYNFTIDTLSAFHMIINHFKLTRNGRGAISADGSSISMTLFTRRLNYNINWQNDTLSFLLTQRH